MERVDALVIGAGVIGLAVARALAQRRRTVLIVERESAIGMHASSRNSEVIHAGLYYEPGSRRARMCRDGRDRLYAHCQDRGIPHRRIGKLIVATHPAQVADLEGIARRAAANGVGDLQWLDATAVSRLEPALRCTAALLSPSTGIVDSRAFLLSLLGEAEDAGATLVTRTSVTRLSPGRDGCAVFFDGAPAPLLRAGAVVNCAGIDAPGVAARIDGFPSQHVPVARYAKGHYFALAGRSPFGRLVYPVPEPGGLGVHFTLDLAGAGRFGPDVEWVEVPDTRVDPVRAARFEPGIRAWWPGLPEGALTPAYAGVRAKITGPGQPAADFRIDGPEVHGVPSLVHLFGIESPGLTASLAIAGAVEAIVTRAAG